MIEPDVMPPAALRPLQRHAQIEVDTFCVECGYNLHGQPVTRDERLGIFVCRCPECGRFHPAGTGTTATSTWMSRLGTALLVLWVLFVLHAIFWICMGLGAVQVVHLETFSYSKMVANDGRDVEWGQVTNAAGTPGGWGAIYADTKQPAPNWKMIRTFTRPENYPKWGWEEIALYVFFGAAIGFTTGVLLVVFFWHWRRKRYPLVMILPFAIAAVVATVSYYAEEYGPLFGWAVSRLLMYAALEAAFISLGILVGRPIMRGLLRTFIPPRPRQHFAFLWRADGKTMPAAPVK
jgi:prepilin signal peptidase PulO-like enzyme (type II secretory pathway)